MKYLSKIKAEAAKRFIPLKQLADSINITEDAFKKAIRNGSLSIDQLHIICNKLSINISDLFSQDNGIETQVNSKQHIFCNKLFC